ncbi:MAG: hypothetical protein ACLGIJ_08300 [Candidatus Limnocylindria bacterium]
MPALRTRRDPWWDLEGIDARHHRVRRKFVAALACAVAIVACGLTTAAWLEVLWPALASLGLGLG